MHQKTLIQRAVPAVLLFVFCVQGLAQNTVNGYLKIGNAEYELKHITAIRVPDTFHPDKFATRLSLSDLPVSEEQLRDPFGVAALKSKGGFHGVTLEIGDERSYVSMNSWSSDHDTMVSMSGTMDEVELSAQTPQMIIGQVKNLQKTFGELTLELYAGFSAALKEPAARPKGEMKKGADALKLESVKVYVAMRKAVREGDMATIRRLARYPQDFEGADGEKFVKMMQEEEPLNLEVVEASETGDTATLTVTGSLDGKAIRRTFDMEKKDGKWSTRNDNWQSN